MTNAAFGNGGLLGAHIGFYLALLLTVSGCCSWTDKHGTRHMLVIGAGWMRINAAKPDAATVTSLHALGVTANGNSFTAGYTSSLATAVPDGAEDVRIEVSRHPFTPMTVEVQKASLIETNPTKGEK